MIPEESALCGFDRWRYDRDFCRSGRICIVRFNRWIEKSLSLYGKKRHEVKKWKKLCVGKNNNNYNNSNKRKGVWDWERGKKRVPKTRTATNWDTGCQKRVLVIRLHYQ